MRIKAVRGLAWIIMRAMVVAVMAAPLWSARGEHREQRAADAERKRGTKYPQLTYHDIMIL